MDTDIDIDIDIAYYDKSGGPYFITFIEFATKKILFHREDGPALIFFYYSEHPICHHYLNGIHHRMDGPSSYVLNKVILKYTIKGIDYTYSEYKKISETPDIKWVEYKLIYGSLGHEE